MKSIYSEMGQVSAIFAVTASAHSIYPYPQWCASEMNLHTLMEEGYGYMFLFY